MKKLLQHQQQYRPIYRDILAGFSSLKFDYSEGMTLFYVKHLSELDYGSMESLAFELDEEAKSKGLESEPEKIKEYIKLGHWSKEEEEEYEQLQKDVHSLGKGVASIIAKSQRIELEKKYEDTKKKLKTSSDLRGELLGVTREQYVEKKQNEELLRKSLFKDRDLKNLAFTEEEYGELTQAEYTDLILLYNLKMSTFQDAEIAKLATLPFFINSIFICKNDPVIFFGKPVIHLTVQQMELFSKGLFYKSILEQGKTPPEEFYENLDKMVNWYDVQSKSKAGGVGGPVTTNAESSIKTSKDCAAGGVSYVGATKEELKAQGAEGEYTDLVSEAEKLKKELGKDELDIYDMAKLHGL